MMKVIKRILFAAAIAVAATTLSGCYERVEPGNVGIIVNRLGDEKGVDNNVKGAGKYWIGWNEELYTFPTFKQMKAYDQPFNFQLSDGTQIRHSLAVAYKVDPTKVAMLFQTYRKGVDDITNIDLRQRIADILNRQANRINTDKFIDGGKSDLLDKVLAQVQGEMSPIGVQVISISWVGSPGYPDTVLSAINAKVEATQKTLQRNQEVQQREAEANMARAQADGEADVIRKKAQADSDAAILRAKGEAEAIAKVGTALNQYPSMKDLRTIEKWDGRLPTTMTPGSTVPFMNLPAGTK